MVNFSSSSSSQSYSWFGRERQKRVSRTFYTQVWKIGQQRILCNIIISRLVEHSICITEIIWVFVPSSLGDSRIDIKGLMEENTFTWTPYRDLLKSVIRGFFDRTSYAAENVICQVNNTYFLIPIKDMNRRLPKIIPFLSKNIKFIIIRSQCKINIKHLSS